MVLAGLGLLVGVVVGTFFISQSFLRVVLPLSLPGVFAGSLLTFIPAMGDFVNAEILGNTQTRMIGNVIQSRFLENNDYPTAAALSFILMAAILVDGGDLCPRPRDGRADERPMSENVRAGDARPPVGRSTEPVGSSTGTCSTSTSCSRSST